MFSSPFRFASLAALALASLTPAFAQAPADVPADHWAHRSVEALYGKVLAGYPDGTFRGPRPLTRYEFAVAIQRLWSLLSGRLDQTEASIAEIERRIKIGSPAPPSLALPALPKLPEIDWASLRRLMSEFEKELASLGADVEEMKKKTGSLAERVSALEARKSPITITGDATLAILGGFSGDGRVALASPGFQTGVDRAGNRVGFPSSLVTLHEAAVSLSGEAGSGVRFKGVFTAGNALTSLGSLTGTRTGRLAEGASEAAIYELNASWSRKALRGEAEFTVGRYGHQIPYIFQRVDNTRFWENDRWDSGDFLVDGVRLALKWSGTEVDIFGGRTGTTRSLDGTLLTAPTVRSFNTLVLPAERLAGADIVLQANPAVAFRGGVVFVDSDQRLGTAPKTFNRMITLGGSMEVKLGSGATLKGGVAKNIYKDGSRTTVDNRNESYFADLGIPLGSLHLEAGYKRREHNSFLNGDWGRFGAVVNPTGYTSFHGSAQLPTKFGHLKASFEKAEGVDRGGNPIGTGGLNKGDDLEALTLEAGFRLRNGWMLTAEYWDTQWTTALAGKPYQTFWTLQASGPLSGAAKLSFGAQLSDADSKGAAFLNNQGLGGRFQGVTLFSQASIKF